MFDANWDLINGDAAHAIEVLNQANQVNVIEAVVHFLMHFYGQDAAVGCTHAPNERVVQELHRTGTLFLLEKPGEYRESAVHITNNGNVVYEPPHQDQVGDHMKGFLAELLQMWPTHGPVEIAAFCLWRLNWIHPFKNGNGRTARAYAYACLCLKLGFVPAGSPTILDLIMQNKPAFEAALRHADLTLENGGQADLIPLNQFVYDLLVQQLSTIPPSPEEGMA